MQSCQRSIALLCRSNIFMSKPNPLAVRYFTSDHIEENKDSQEKPKDEGETPKTVELSGFAKYLINFSKPQPEEPKKIESFPHLLRHSKLIDLGDPEGKIVPGRIFHIVGDDLYIDFGAKFHCVCPRPLKNPGDYVRGTTVRVRIKELELSTKFLGATKDLTLLEADCTLIGIISSPMRNVQTV